MDQFTLLILKFDIEDFTDPGLLKIRLTLTGSSLWFCLLTIDNFRNERGAGPS